MGPGISEVLTFAVGVDISLLSVIAVILMLFSPRARVNGPLFLLGWVVALTVVFGVVYVLADRGGVATSSSASDTVSWGKIVFGVGSIAIAGPVVYYLFGGSHAKAELDVLKGWLGVHNAAVTTVVFVIFGVDLIAKGLAPLTA